MTQLVLNNKEATATKISVFFINYGCHPNLFATPKKSLQTIVALKDISQLKKLYKKY